MVWLTLTLRVQDSTPDGCGLHLPTTRHKLRLDSSARGAGPMLRNPVSVRAAFLYLTSDCRWRPNLVRRYEAVPAKRLIIRSFSRITSVSGIGLAPDCLAAETFPHVFCAMKASVDFSHRGRARLTQPRCCMPERKYIVVDEGRGTKHTSTGVRRR
jgi:hypothetical protein